MFRSEFSYFNFHVIFLPHSIFVKRVMLDHRFGTYPLVIGPSVYPRGHGILFPTHHGKSLFEIVFGTMRRGRKSEVSSALFPLKSKSSCSSSNIAHCPPFHGRPGPEWVSKLRSYIHPPKRHDFDSIHCFLCSLYFPFPSSSRSCKRCRGSRVHRFEFPLTIICCQRRRAGLQRFMLWH